MANVLNNFIHNNTVTYVIITNDIVIYIIVSSLLLCNMRKQKKKTRTELEYRSEITKLGKRIRALRVERGYTSAMKFAYDNELSSVQMVRWEQGRNITFETQMKLADAFGISVTELLKGF
jgi:transcriptional regulator with XRE-family HTH domain